MGLLPRQADGLVEIRLGDVIGNAVNDIQPISSKW